MNENYNNMMNPDFYNRKPYEKYMNLSYDQVEDIKSEARVNYLKARDKSEKSLMIEWLSKRIEIEVREKREMQENFEMRLKEKDNKLEIKTKTIEAYIKTVWEIEQCTKCDSWKQWNNKKSERVNCIECKGKAYIIKIDTN